MNILVFHTFVHKQLIAVASIIPFMLVACSSQSESSPVMTPMATQSASPQPSVSDSCAVLEQMQVSLSTAVSDLIANPDLVTEFETEIDNQVALLNDLVSSLQGDSVEGQQLQTDLDAVVLAKDKAVKILMTHNKKITLSRKLSAWRTPR